jgi:hypothetical protein
MLMRQRALGGIVAAPDDSKVSADIVWAGRADGIWPVQHNYAPSAAASVVCPGRRPRCCDGLLAVGTISGFLQVANSKKGTDLQNPASRLCFPFGNYYRLAGFCKSVPFWE